MTGRPGPKREYKGTSSRLAVRVPSPSRGSRKMHPLYLLSSLPLPPCTHPPCRLGWSCSLLASSKALPCLS